MNDSKKNGSSATSPEEQASQETAVDQAPQQAMPSTGEEPVQIPSEVLDQMVDALASVDERFVHGRAPDEVSKLIIGALLDTQKLQPYMLARKPTWGVVMKRGSNLLLKSAQHQTGEDFEIRIFCPRNPALCNSRDEVLNFLAQVALVTSPIARAVAKAMGVEVSFVMSDQTLPGQIKKKTGLIVPG